MYIISDSSAFEAHDVISTRLTALLEQKESIATFRFQDRSIKSAQKENLDLFQKKEIMERLGIKAVRTYIKCTSMIALAYYIFKYRLM